MDSLAGGNRKPRDITVCDIMGEWGAYQWSLNLFALVYSAIFGVVVVIGPIWTPEMSFVCAPSNYSQMSLSQQEDYVSRLNFSAKPHECFEQANASYLNSQLLHLPIGESGALRTDGQQIACETYLFDDSKLGKVLTNSFNLVCADEWLKSLLSSSALAGMLFSSLTLGRVSDKLGRVVCVRIGVVCSVLATLAAIFAHNYILLNVCFMIISYFQVGVANALCTLGIEATSPKYRLVSLFQYGFGWGIGILLTPLINNLTLNYVHALIVLLLWQLLMLPWMHYGVFESIRWLLSEGKINRAQIELQRACRINRVQNGAKLAQDISQIQRQQMRKASRMIEQDIAPRVLAKALEQRVDTTAQELDMLSAAIKQSFGFCDDYADLDDTDLDSLTADSERPPLPAFVGASQLAAGLSPTLKRASFTVVVPSEQQQQQVAMTTTTKDPQAPNGTDQIELTRENVGSIPVSQQHRLSLTTQGLIHLAMKYKRVLEEKEDGSNFLSMMFHRKLWRATALLMAMSVMLETSYYGFIQANKFVGDNVTLNYVASALGEFAASFCYVAVMWTFERRVAIILPVAAGTLACAIMAATYYLIPDESQWMKEAIRPLEQLDGDMFKLNLNLTSIDLNPFDDSERSAIISGDKILSANLTDVTGNEITGPNWWLMRYLGYSLAELLALRHLINLWIMNIGKLSVSVGIQVAETIALEIYPNNLRQTGYGALVFVGRIGSIVAPFLYNDLSEDKIIFKSTLVTLAVIGFLSCIFAPFFIKNTKNKELCDHMQDIE